MQEAREEAEAMELVKRLLAERVGPFHERYQDEQKAQLVGEYLINEMKLRKQEELERQIHQLMKMVNPRFRGIDGLFDLLRDAL